MLWIRGARVFLLAILLANVSSIEIDDFRFSQLMKRMELVDRLDLKGMRADVDQLKKTRSDVNPRSSESSELEHVPVGTILPFAGSNLNNLGDWLPCDGRTIKQEDYPTLFAAIGHSFKRKSFDQSVLFQLPDLRGRAPVGAGRGDGLTNRGVGNYFGIEKHQLSASEMPSHTHSVNDPGHRHTYSQYFNGYRMMDIGSRDEAIPDWDYRTSVSVSSSRTGISLGSTGSNRAHENIQPSTGVNFIIKAPAVERDPDGTPWPLPSNLLGFWPLDSLQQVRDVGPNKVATTQQPLSFTSGPFGQPNTAVKPSQSTTGVISASRITGEGSFTVSMFLRKQSNQTQGGIFEFLDQYGTDKAFQMRFKGNDTIEIGANGITIGEYPMVLRKGAWTFLAVTFDAKTALFVVHGKHGAVKRPRLQSHILASNSFNNNGMRLGYATRWNQGLQNTDSVACLMVYNTVLTAKQIRAAQDACRIVQLSPLCGSPKLPIPPVPSASSLTTIPRPGEFPYIASLQLNSKHVCSATIVDQFWLVTSALCLKETASPSAYSIVVGESDLNATEGFSRTHQVSKIILSSDSVRGIALVEVTDPIDMTNDYVNDACLFTSDQEDELDWNSNQYVFGWGINGRKPMISQSLGRYVPGRILTEDQCSQSLSEVYNASIDYCFMSSTSDKNVPCKGDEGSPLLAVAPSVSGSGIGERLVSVGLYYSHGTNCSAANPALFANMANSMPWIVQNIACAVPGVVYPETCIQL